MAKLRSLLQDEPLKGIQKAVWWAEYVIRHKGTRHLRSPTIDIEWYKYLLVDMVFVLIGLPIFILVAIVKVIAIVKQRKIRRKTKFL